MLRVEPGEVVGFRSQLGADPQSGLSPTSFSAQVYPYNNPPGQLVQRDGVDFFTPKSQPVRDTGPLPGRPFSIALPQSLPSGKYAMLIQIGWPNPAGSRAVYGFTLEAP